MRRLGWVRLEDTGRWRDALAPFFARHDVVLAPSLAAPPVAASSWAERGWFANYWAATRYTGAFALPWNLAGWPSVAVPAGIHPTGTPLSVQLSSTAGNEPLLIALAGQIEARPHPIMLPRPDRGTGAGASPVSAEAVDSLPRPAPGRAACADL
jgi:amidase